MDEKFNAPCEMEGEILKGLSGEDRRRWPENGSDGHEVDTLTGNDKAWGVALWQSDWGVWKLISLEECGWQLKGKEGVGKSLAQDFEITSNHKGTIWWTLLWIRNKNWEIKGRDVKLSWRLQ